MANPSLIILDGCTFFYSDPNGDVEAEEAEGFFYHDVRHLSRWRLSLNGGPVEPLTSRRVDYYSARIVGTPEGKRDGAPVALRRDRFVTEGVHEDLVVTNYSRKEQRVRLELEFGSDFADVMEAQKGGSGNSEGRRWVDVGKRSATLWFERDGYRRGTALTFRRTPRRLTSKRAVFELRLAPREEWSTCVDITPVVDGSRRNPLLRCGGFREAAPEMPKRLDEWLREAPSLDAYDGALERTYRQSLLDLAALRIRPDEAQIRWAMPGGGLPWFMTIFGRDSLIAAYEALPFNHDLAEATLEALAHFQATEWDDFRDAEPGKMLHELRRGTLASLGKVPHSPYYGTHDATLLWLILLDEYERWSGDSSFVREHEHAARAALEWLEGPGDPDRDGYLEYRKRSTSDHALANHCWKDSDDSILFADGTKAEPPIATCEIQGYAYDARIRTARLAREFWADPELAERLEREAAELKQRFNRDFWSKPRRHHVLALDGRKRQVDSMTSNVGHLLWSGIVERPRAAAVVRRLMRDDMFSGWGIRSMSSNDAGFNPLEYHNGTVWPHDTAIVAEGMRRYGYREEAGRLCVALLDAAAAFANQLPEVFAGFSRDEPEVPVEYPDALTPQAWAAGAPLLALRTLLGLDVVAGKLRVHPHVPRELGKVRLRGLHVRGRGRDVP
jgi:glycogen debranching enzyme